MNKAVPALVASLLLAGLCWVFPLFHIRSLKAVHAARSNAQFDATGFVERFWTEQLLPATEKATDAAKVLEAVAADSSKVGGQFGRTVGLSSSYFLFLRGSGRVVSIDAEQIGISLQPEGDRAEIVIPLGLVFGNAVRDGTGLLDSSNHPNAQEFNDISAALNNIVETKVLPGLQRMATVGERIRFAGCAEVGEEDTDLKPLKLVPIWVKPD